MITAVMQPYFFPYIGYFQLMNSADLFVLYDDVQYIRRGWVNRNRILANGAAKWVTIPVEKKPRATPINEMRYLVDAGTVRSTVDSIAGAYQGAPHFDTVMDLVRVVLQQGESNVARYNERLLHTVAGALNIDCDFVRSSDLGVDRTRKGQERVLDICRTVGADRYVNAIGGMELYDRETFRAAGIDLEFVRPREVTYEQFGESFVANLSIIDVMMFNGAQGAASLLDRCTLV